MARATAAHHVKRAKRKRFVTGFKAEQQAQLESRAGITIDEGDDVDDADDADVMLSRG